jgi:hypothetical protein
VRPARLASQPKRRISSQFAAATFTRLSSVGHIVEDRVKANRTEVDHRLGARVSLPPISAEVIVAPRAPPWFMLHK